MACFSQRPDEFKPEHETWSAYVERMELLFEAHDVDDGKKVPVLLSSVGAATYGLLRNLVQPDKPKDKTFDQVVTILRDYYEPKPLVIAERFRYRKCVQKSGQTATEYAAELRQLAAKCDFGDRLDDDGFVSGVSSEACQRKLLSEDRLTFARAVELAVNMETAHRDAQQLRTGDDVTAVHKGSSVALKGYSGETIPVKGQFIAKVTYGNQTADLPLIVVAGGGPSLCGREWLDQIRLNWKMIKKVTESTTKPKSIQDVLDKYADVFKDELGTLKGIKAAIFVKPDAVPKFHKARVLPFAMKEKVDKELERLEKDGVISLVKHSEWAAPVVPVTKKDGGLRLCGDYKVTVNLATNTETYPLPRIEEVLAALCGGKIFSKIDLAAAYQQVLLDDESKKYTTVNTHKGLFVYNLLCFGINSAVSIFQRIMENVMRDLNVLVYLDDLLVMGRDEAEHLLNLDRVLQRLQENGLRVKKSKCDFGKTQIEYLGHMLDEKGVYPSKDKVRAVHDAPTPTNIKELRAFLGLVNYYGRFLPQQSTVLAPLYKLLKDQTKWRWSKVEQSAFDKCKEMLTGDKVLVHYDPSLPLSLACDASAYGIGAVIQQTTHDGQERPVAYASRTLSPAEKNYSQIEKEALSLVYGVKKFHQYLWGRKFNLITDHKPLLTLFGEHKGLPTMAAARIQRWAIILSAYDYHIIYRQSDKHGNADEQIVTDNATTFMSEEFQLFMKRNGILHTTGAPRHPATNGLAERYVATFKAGMKKLDGEDLNVEDKVSHFLLRYRTTPNSATGESPADLHLKRHVRLRLDFLRPNIAMRVRRRQYQKKEEHDSRATERQFDVDDPGETTDQVYRRHGDQLRHRYPQEVSDPEPLGATQSADQESNLAGPVSTAPAPQPFTLDQPEPPDPETVTLRRSERTARRPSRYRD
uniref:ribonuclease H n=1 Tax=Knipowitschia caucasica TaxID=637954 RepID=A0AAV2KXD0_KNICA